MRRITTFFAFSSLFFAFFIGSTLPTTAENASLGPVVANNDLPEDATPLQISLFTGFIEPLRPVGKASADASTSVLVQTINIWNHRHTEDDFSDLESFLRRYPNSTWAPAITYNLGKFYYGTGYFSRAIAAYEAVWKQCRDNNDPAAFQFGHQAVAELSTMYARVGRKQELTALLGEIKGRPLTDNAKVQRERAADGLSGMISRPEISFRCGTHALSGVCRALGKELPAQFLEGEPSTDAGFSLVKLKEIAAKKLQLRMTMVQRKPGSAVPVPAVVHLRCGHYGALVKAVDGHFLLADPTFGNDTWMTLKAIDDEASGYFLVPADKVTGDLTAVSDADGGKIFGKGNVQLSDPNASAVDDHRCNKPPCEKGMAGYSFLTMLVSLSVSDTPITIPTPYGPSLSFNITFNQQEANQAATKLYTHFSPQWVSNWVSYLEENTSSDSNNITIYLPDGGSEINTTYTSTDTHQGYYIVQPTHGTQLFRVAAGQFERRNFDGSKLVYSRATSPTGSPRKVFLTQVVDSWGNAVTINYDATYTARITSITSAHGKSLYFFYGDVSDVYLTTGIADNAIWNSAYKKVSLAYQTIGGAKRLTSITDPVGIMSSFGYDATSGVMNSLTTPYGTTTFASGTQTLVGGGSMRWLEATDGNGDKEHLEYRTDTDVSTILPVTPAPSGGGGSYDSSYVRYRNSWYWDKKAWHDAPGDITKAHLYHWLHTADGTSSAGILEREKPSLENHIWYNYPGQSWSYYVGSFPSPSMVSRIIEGPAGTQVSAFQKFSYNAVGNVTQSTDADGHVLQYNYDTTGYDLQSVQVKDGTGWDTLASYASYVNHRPQTVTDASGVTTSYTYNSKGQMVQEAVTAGGQTLATKYTYDQQDGALTCGFLTKTEHSDAANPSTTFVTLGAAQYDSYGRVQNTTNSEAYTRTYSFDALDRPLQVTHPDGSTEQFSYLQDSHMTLQCTGVKDRANRWTTTHYDLLGHPDSTTDALNQTTQYAWCRCGAMKQLTDPAGKVTSWTRDVEGRVTEKVLSDTKHYLYTFQPLSGRLSTVAFPMDADASATTYTNYYSAGGALVKKDYTSATMKDVTFEYNDILGRLTKMSDGLGTGSTVYTYVGFQTPALPGAGKLAKADGPFNHDTLRYSYDAFGRLYMREVLKDDNTITRSESVSFDGLERVSQTVNDLGTFTKTFAATNYTGVPDSISLPGGLSTVITRYGPGDGANALRLHTLEHHNADPSTWQSNIYTYDLTGNIITWVQPRHRWDMGYDSVDQLKRVNSTDVGDGLVESRKRWDYDAAGNITGSTTSQGSLSRSETRTITGRNQLTGVTGPTTTLVEGTVNEISHVTVNGQLGSLRYSATPPYHFQTQLSLAPGDRTVTIQATDGSSNTATSNYTLTVRGDHALDYDTNGNLLHKYWQQAGSPPTQWIKESYTWDAENRLTGWEKRQLTVTDQQTDAVLATTTWTYDGLGRRVQEHNVIGATTTDHQILWDGMEMVQWRNADGSVQRNLYADGELDQSVSPAVSYLYITDHLGNIRGWQRLSDGARGEADYTAWGQRGIVVNTTGMVPVKSFTGHYQHQTSGLILAPYRAYDGEFGRWLSEDPIGEMGGLNLYGYVDSGPVARRDPLGLNPSPYLPDPNMKPPGWTSDWPTDTDARGPHSIGPDGKKYYPHDDKGHWPHYDWVDPDGNEGSYPEKSQKPRPGQKRLRPEQGTTCPWPKPEDSANNRIISILTLWGELLKNQLWPFGNSLPADPPIHAPPARQNPSFGGGVPYIPRPYIPIFE